MPEPMPPVRPRQAGEGGNVCCLVLGRRRVVAGRLGSSLGSRLGRCLVGDFRGLGLNGLRDGGLVGDHLGHLSRLGDSVVGLGCGRHIVVTTEGHDGTLLRLLGGRGDALQRQRQAAALGVGIGVVLAKPVTESALIDSLVKVLSGRDSEDLRERAELEAPRSGDLRAALVGARILVVDDATLNQETARGLLEAVGCVVVTADDGREALERVQREGLWTRRGAFLERQEKAESSERKRSQQIVLP